MYRPLCPAFNPLDCDYEPRRTAVMSTGQSLYVKDFLPTVHEQLRAPKIEHETFCLLCKLAINEGMVSQQALKERFGDAIPKNADKVTHKWAMPDPATTREILTFFSTLDPVAAIGSKLPWRHVQCAQAEAAPKLPGLQRTAMAHRHS